MSKPIKRSLPGKEYFLWDYEMQTKMKHQVLVEYIKNWSKILSANSSAYYFDCFGGCGAYLDDNGAEKFGSPFLITDIADELKEKNGKTMHVLVSEPVKENFDNLVKIKSLRYSLSGNPHLSNQTFEAIIHNKWTKERYRSYPSFFLIDPFGFSLKMKDLVDIMHYPQNEILINFMFDFINRFISDDTCAAIFDELFGCQDWRVAKEMSGEQREGFIIGLYRKQLKKFSKYVFAFRMSYPDRDRTYYYLIHATNNLKGCSIMKSAFASQNYGRVEYLGYKQNELTLFDLKEFREGELEKRLTKQYSGRQMTFNSIVDEIIDETFYLEKDIRAALKSMRSEGKIKTTPVTSKTDKGLGGNDIILFDKV